MVVNEEQREHEHYNWRSRVARERQDLSLSVEETLGETLPEDMLWQDDGSLSRETRFPPRTQDKAIVLPRLSLQSRTITAVQEEQAVDSSTRSQQRVPSGESGAKKSTTITHSTSILRRFAQRLTSSLAALGSAVQSEEIHVAEDEFIEQKPRLLFGPIDPTQEQISPVTGDSRSNVTPTKSIQRDTSGELRTGPGRQRLAGRTTRIRLETVGGSLAGRKQKAKLEGTSTSAEIPQLPLEQDTKQVEPATFSTEIDPLSLSQELPVANWTSVHIPTVSGNTVSEQEHQGETSFHMAAVKKDETSAHLAAVESNDESLAHPACMHKDELLAPALAVECNDESSTPLTASTEQEPETTVAASSAVSDIRETLAFARGLLSGQGTFVSGQSDVTIANSQVTERSVVLVTLTSNPGPVVVQYVSLQPGIGCTVHLTAPCQMKTTFNYLVLPGELF